MRRSASGCLPLTNPQEDVLLQPSDRPYAQLDGFRKCTDAHVVVNGCPRKAGHFHRWLDSQDFHASPTVLVVSKHVTTQYFLTNKQTRVKKLLRTWH